MCKHLKQDYSLSLQILCQNEIYMKKYPCVLSIAGSDCSGGAGIQADLKTISALGGYAATAITAITVQNTLGVRAIHPVPPVYVRGQIEAVMEDIRPDAVKIGMINDVEIVKTIASCLRTYRPRFVVFDPVMVSTSGHRLIEEDAISALTRELMPLASLITPNLSEAEVLTEHRIGYVDDNESCRIGIIKVRLRIRFTERRTFGGRQDVRCITNSWRRQASSLYFRQDRKQKHTRNRMYSFFRHCYFSGTGI